MWQCSSCEYVNDDWDERCLRCGVDRVTSEAERMARQAGEPREPAGELSDIERRVLESQARVDPGQPVQPPAGESRRQAEEKQAEQREEVTEKLQGRVDQLIRQEAARGGDRIVPEKRGRNDLAPILIIAISLLGLFLVAYVAWSRGMLKLPEPQAAQALDFTELGFESRPAYPKNDGLLGIIESKDKADRQLRPHAQLLHDVQAAYAELQKRLQGASSQEDLAADLDIASEVSKRFLNDYEQFEGSTVTRNKKLDIDKVSLLREQYGERATELMGVLQAGYLAMDNPEHPAFLYTDSLPQMFARFGYIDASDFAGQWQEVREQRRQRELDVQYADMIEEIKSWYSTLVYLHDEVNKAIREIGEVGSNRGRLNPAAVKLVILLDSYAYKIEELNTQFEEFAGALPETESDTVNENLAKFRALALEDHMYCFTEIYKRYAEDRYAELSQYDNLLDHYEYAQQNWPSAELDYQGIFTTFENRWKERWAGQD